MKAVELTDPQGGEAWLNSRLGCLTASNASKVLARIKSGEAAERRNYRAQLVVERLTGKRLDMFQNDAMRRGTELEPLARLAYESKTGNIVEESGFWKDGWRGASPDGKIDSNGLLEIKCPLLATHLGYLKAGTMPSEYIAQVQMQMWVTGREWCDFASYAPEFPAHLQLFIVRVQKDDEYIKTLELETAAFLIEVADDVEQLSNKQGDKE